MKTEKAATHKKNTNDRKSVWKMVQSIIASKLITYYWNKGNFIAVKNQQFMIMIFFLLEKLNLQQKKKKLCLPRKFPHTQPTKASIYAQVFIFRMQFELQFSFALKLEIITTHQFQAQKICIRTHLLAIKCWKCHRNLFDLQNITCVEWNNHLLSCSKKYEA